MRLKDIHIILAMIIMAVTSSCERYSLDPVDSGIDVNWPGYIYFNADVSSKGALLTDMKGKSFNVIAYKYSNTYKWSTYKTTGTPTSDFAFPTAVACNATTGICSYSPIREWDNSSKYTFFAFYPVTGQNGVVTSSTSSTTDTPVIKYTVQNWTTPSALPDVVTAMVSDADNRGDGTVNFTFKHRLSCIQIEARNLNDADESVKDLKVKFTSSLYTNILIPLDPSIDTTPSGNKANAEYSVVGSTAVTITPASTSQSSTQNLSGDNNIIIIPHIRTGDSDPWKLAGNITFKDKNNKKRDLSFSTNKSIEPGKKYSFILTFTGETISVTALESGEWEDKDQDIVFE